MYYKNRKEEEQMKTASKVFIILGIITGGLLCGISTIYLLIYSSGIYALALDIIGFRATFYAVCLSMLLFGIAMLITGSVSLRRLSYATSKNELILTSVCCLLFCNMIAGILMLCLKDSDLNNNTNQITDNKESHSITTNLESLKQLKELKDNGTITEEFNKMKADLLNNL